MISKKVIASTLAGTKALGVSGALGWALGLFDGEGLENVMDGEVDAVEHEPGSELNQDEKGPSNPEDEDLAEPEVKAQDSQVRADDGKGIQLGGGSAIKGVVTSSWSTYFAEGGKATEHDRKAVEKSSTWKSELKKWMQMIMVKTGDDSWNCGLKPVSIEGIDSNHDFSEFESQTQKLINAIKDNDDYRKQFVTNCSGTRRDLEIKSGNTSEIELETEKVSYNKYKFKEKDKYFERLWTGDFRGIDRLSENDRDLLNVSSGGVWSIKEEPGTKGKIKISPGNGDLVCYISGTLDKPLDSKSFRDNEEKLKDILGVSMISDEIEKKKYIIRNCRRNKLDIKGLKIKTNGSNWWFDDDSLKKISEGMYENPKEA